MLKLGMTATVISCSESPLNLEWVQFSKFNFLKKEKEANGKPECSGSVKSWSQQSQLQNSATLIW